MNRFTGMLYLWFSGLSIGMMLMPWNPRWFVAFLPFQSVALGFLGYLKLKQEFAS